MMISPSSKTRPNDLRLVCATKCYLRLMYNSRSVHHGVARAVVVLCVVEIRQAVALQLVCVA